ncbi:MAG: lytic transglycosylase domain-containing protein [Sulfuricella denitrificans]|nr:lytic transglycosylase domain-containing protein [Sulfuricella denitrificans]
MKFTGSVLASLCLLGLSQIPAARANIYVYTTADGSVSLSNVPADPRYKPLVTGQTGAPDNASAVRLARSSERAGKSQYDGIVEEVARTHGIDGALLHAVISVESHYNSQAVSSKGAAGLMQLMPATAKRYGVSDSLDPVQNLHGGAQYLRDLLTLFNSDLKLALAAYNAGENAVIRHGNRIPPYRETRDYVPRVLNFYHQYQARL